MEPPLGRNGRIDEGRRRRRRDTYENTRGIFIVRNGPSDVCKKAFQWRGGRTRTRPSSTRRKRRGGKTRGHFREVKLAVRGPHFSPNMSSSDDNFRRSNLNSAPPPPRIEIARSTFLSFVSPRPFASLACLASTLRPLAAPSSFLQIIFRGHLFSGSFPELLLRCRSFAIFG